jgi:hypothetical protein
MLDLKNTKHETNGSNLFDTSMTPVSNIRNGGFSVVINPFAEAYTELDNGEGVGFKTIASYIRDGGIFINLRGQPFTYRWDVHTGNSQLLVNFIPALSDIQTDYIGGISVLHTKESVRVPSEALIIKRQFDLDTEWDHPENNCGAKRSRR